MTEGQSGMPLRTPGDDGARAAELTIAEVLRLLSAGASGSILIALGDGPLRTKELTERIPSYAARTIYRYAGKLTQLRIIDRHEEPGVPSKVIHQLTEPCGRELHDLVEAFADASLARLSSGEIGAPAWSSLSLLADLWESGIIEDLNLGPRSATELARGPHGLSFHQVSRRAGLFAKAGFIEEVEDVGRHRRYALTEKARRGMALIAGLGRWRRHIVPEGGSGLTAVEVAGLMRTVLPLVVIPQHAGKNLEMRIVPVGENTTGEEEVWAKIGGDGVFLSIPTPSGSAATSASASAQGKATSWVDSILDGPHNGLDISGEADLVTGCLNHLHAALWKNGKSNGKD